MHYVPTGWDRRDIWLEVLEQFVERRGLGLCWPASSHRAELLIERRLLYCPAYRSFFDLHSEDEVWELATALK